MKPHNIDDKMEAWYFFHTICLVTRVDVDFYHMAGAIQNLCFTENSELPHWVLPTREQIQTEVPWLMEHWFSP